MIPHRLALTAASLLVATVTITASPARAVPILPPLSFGWVVNKVQSGHCDAALPELPGLGSQPDPTGGRALYLLAHCLLQRGDADAAIKAFDQVAERFAPLADHARLYAAQAARQGGRDEEAAARLERLLAGTPISPVAQRARLAYAEALITAGKPGQAIPPLTRLLADPLDDASYAQAWWLLGQATEGTGDRAQAARAYGMAWWSVPDAIHATAAYERLHDLLPDQPPVPPPDARVRRADRLIALGEFTMAESELVDALHEPMSLQMTADAWYQLGLLRLGTDEAVYAFQQSAQVSAEFRSRALFWLGRALQLNNRRIDAQAVWRRLLAEGAGSEWAPRAMLALAVTAERRRNLTGAEQWLRAAAQQYPFSTAGDEARWRLGWVLFQQKRLRDAERQFVDAATRFPTTSRVPANLFWAAKVRARRGGDARDLLMEVARRFPLTFYGWRARQLANLPEPTVDEAPAAQRLGEDQAASPDEELAALGFDADAVEIVEARLETSADPRNRRTAALLWGRMGVFHRSVTAAEQVVWPEVRDGTMPDRELWMLAYPRAYWNILQKVTGEHRIDPYLVLAVMREESRFDPRAVSLADAIGLTQLLPTTASTVAGTELRAVDLMDPETNITIGTRYLVGLMRQFNNDMILAVAAYNAGPTAARRIARMPRADLDVFVESIPITETRVYVQHVLQSYQIYRWLYP